MIDRRAFTSAFNEFEALGGQRVRTGDGLLVVHVPSSVLEAKPWLAWNAFVALMSYSSLEELHPVQHAASRAYEFYSDVESGGHAKFFDRHAGAGLNEAVDAVAAVGAPDRAERLNLAVTAWRNAGGQATKDQLAAWDAAFAEGEPLSMVLEMYLASHADRFVVSAGQ